MATASPTPPPTDQQKTLSRTKSLNKLSQPRTAPNARTSESTASNGIPNRMKSLNDGSRPRPVIPPASDPSTAELPSRMRSMHTPSPTTSSQSQSQSQSTHTRLRSVTTTAAPNFSHPHPTSTIDKHRYFTLKGRAQAFCSAFLNPGANPPEKILTDHFTTGSDLRIIEHGPPWAQAKLPYIARPFRGKNEGLWYFRLQAETVEFLPDRESFSGSEGVVVDPEAVIPGQLGRGVATVVGRSRYRAVKSGQSWEARFVWRLSGFDEEGRIGLWEVWGDALSAWVAVGSGGGTPF